MKTLSLKLPASLHHELETAARRRGRSKSEVLRTALEQYLHGSQSAGADSFLEKAVDVIGSVSGPCDLSTNPKRLKGFGK